jgi:hypothetical protein
MVLPDRPAAKETMGSERLARSIAASPGDFRPFGWWGLTVTGLVAKGATPRRIHHEHVRCTQVSTKDVVAVDPPSRLLDLTLGALLCTGRSD